MGQKEGCQAALVGLPVAGATTGPTSTSSQERQLTAATLLPGPATLLPGPARRFGPDAPPHVAITHYTELAASKGVVLSRADIINDKVVSQAEVRGWWGPAACQFHQASTTAWMLLSCCAHAALMLLSCCAYD